MSTVNKIFSGVGFIFMVVLVVGIIGGYLGNIYKLINSDFEDPYKSEIIRGIGVFPPIGVIVGWMDIGDENTIPAKSE